MINLIYILIIIFFIFRLRYKKEKFTEITRTTSDKIKKCVNNTYLSNFDTIDNLNKIAMELNSQNNFTIASDLDLTDAKIIINHDSNILSGNNKVNFLKKILKHGDVISLRGKENVFASFQNCVGTRCKENDNVWNRQFKVESLKSMPEINQELKDNPVLDKNKIKAYKELLKTDPECKTLKCKKYHHFWKLHDYYNGPEGKYLQLGKNHSNIGTLKFDKYVGLETTATLTSQHNSKEAYLYRKQFLKDCENKDLNYDEKLCKKVKDFKPLPKRKKGEYII